MHSGSELHAKHCHSTALGSEGHGSVSVKSDVLSAKAIRSFPSVSVHCTKPIGFIVWPKLLPTTKLPLIAVLSPVLICCCIFSQGLPRSWLVTARPSSKAVAELSCHVCPSQDTHPYHTGMDAKQGLEWGATHCFIFLSSPQLGSYKTVSSKKIKIKINNFFLRERLNYDLKHISLNLNTSQVSCINHNHYLAQSWSCQHTGKIYCKEKSRD